MPGWSVIAFGAALGLFWTGSTVMADAKVRQAASTHARSHDGHRPAQARWPARHRRVAAHSGRTQKGKASVYAAGLGGQTMADGTRFDPRSNAAASKTLALGTTARVRNLSNGHVATVRIRDRGPYRAGRIIDVSSRSANALGIRKEGVAPVAVTPLRS